MQMMRKVNEETSWGAFHAEPEPHECWFLKAAQATAAHAKGFAIKDAGKLM